MEGDRRPSGSGQSQGNRRAVAGHANRFVHRRDLPLLIQYWRGGLRAAPMAGVPAGARGTGCGNDTITSGRRSRIENHNIHFSHYRHTNDQTRNAGFLDHARACRCVMRRADGPRGRTPNLNKNNDKRPAEKTAVDCTPCHGAIGCRGWIARFAASVARRRPQTDGDDAQSLPRHRVGQHARCVEFRRVCPSSFARLGARRRNGLPHSGKSTRRRNPASQTRRGRPPGSVVMA